MTSPALHPGAAHDLLDGVLIGWVAAEVLLRLRNLGGRSAFDWTFLLVVAFTAAGINLALRAAHLPVAGFGGGWALDRRAGGTARNRLGGFVVPFLVVYLTHRGYISAQASLAVSAYSGGKIAAGPVGGLLTDRLGGQLVTSASMTAPASLLVAAL
jgi:hypothetical protein